MKRSRRNNEKTRKEQDPGASALTLEGSSLTDTLRDLITSTVGPIMERLDALERSTRDNSSTSASENLTEEIGAPGSPRRELIMVQSPVKPIFDGRRTHPVTFIEDLEKYVKRMGVSHDKLNAALECLVGDARNWTKLYTEKWTTYEEFRADFLDQYWGREAQNKVKRRINNEKWNSYQKTMSEYFAEIYSEAKRLTCYSSDDVIVDEIMQHYPQEIRRLWVSTEGKGAIAASRFLKNLEGASSEDNGPRQHNAMKSARAAVIQEIEPSFQRRGGQNSQETGRVQKLRRFKESYKKSWKKPSEENVAGETSKEGEN